MNLVIPQSQDGLTGMLCGSKPELWVITWKCQERMEGMMITESETFKISSRWIILDWKKARNAFGRLYTFIELKHFARRHIKGKIKFGLFQVIIQLIACIKHPHISTLSKIQFKVKRYLWDHTGNSNVLFYLIISNTVLGFKEFSVTHAMQWVLKQQ